MNAFWTGWAPASCMPDRCFCEQLHDGLVAQPSNTGSSFAFVAVGLWILGLAWQDRTATQNAPNPLVAQPGRSGLYGAAVILIGLGSAFYHASLTFVGQWLDVMSMYLLITFALLYAASRFNPRLGERFAAVYVGVNVLLGTGLVLVPGLRRYVFALLVLATLALELTLSRRCVFRRRTAYLGASVGALAFGFAVWIVDLQRILCAPESLLQGHAVWHLAGAVAATLLYLYLRTEQPISPDSETPLRG